MTGRHSTEDNMNDADAAWDRAVERHQQDNRRLATGSSAKRQPKAAKEIHRDAENERPKEQF